MITVGIRQLKNRLSQYLRIASAGERVVVTERGRPLAIIVPSTKIAADQQVEALVRVGLARWGGGKPRGARCGSGSWGGQRPSLGGYVTGTGAPRGAPAAGGC